MGITGLLGCTTYKNLKFQPRFPDSLWLVQEITVYLKKSETKVFKAQIQKKNNVINLVLLEPIYLKPILAAEIKDSKINWLKKPNKSIKTHEIESILKTIYEFLFHLKSNQKEYLNKKYISKNELFHFKWLKPQDSKCSFPKYITMDTPNSPNFSVTIISSEIEC